MGKWGTLGLTFRKWACPGVLLLFVCGCAALPPNSFLDPTKVGWFGTEVHEGGIRRILSPRETPPGLANATEPTPEDLVPWYDEYRLRPGDVVAVTIQELLGPAQPFSAALEVNTLGEVRIPMLGSVKAIGLTERELEQEITVRLQEAEILPRPVVLVFTQSRRGRRFTIIGGVTQPGPYPLTDPDMRLLDGIGMAGDISPTAQMLYVIRREDTVPEVPDYPPELDPGVEQPVADDDEAIIPPPPEPPGSMMSAVGLARGQEPPPEDDPVSREELEELLVPPRATTQEATTREAAPDEPFAPIIFDPQTGEVLEVPAEAAPEAEEADLPADGELSPDDLEELEELEEPFDWEDVEDFALDQRVIGIPVAQLRGGDPRYNIVLRNRDVVNVPVDTGAFYAMGEVNRPGVYSFGGRDITVKQAIAIVGGFTPLAWPQRCEIIRREPGTDKQVTYRVDLDAVFSGRADDFYLRDDDILNVGTHVAAPFLFVLRNSFRFTYGFGFVYDRNFADKDAYGARLNPEIREQQARARRGLPF